MSSKYHISDSAWEGHYRDIYEGSHGYDPLDPYRDDWTEDDLDVLDEWEEDEEER